MFFQISSTQTPTTKKHTRQQMHSAILDIPACVSIKQQFRSLMSVLGVHILTQMLLVSPHPCFPGMCHPVSFLLFINICSLTAAPAYLPLLDYK